ncbi:hypothetical protein AVEN_172328-1 [Araneus ventricosus]|uniref:Uncharacterized protein n=1 Tax=Araneus ventricosus TaxID=182803 RepID=A0A4Y2E1H0_ARAVE|nr:hypothetical protein AVEN_172328-1 [Araneus ventricosus]
MQKIQSDGPKKIQSDGPKKIQSDGPKKIQTDGRIRSTVRMFQDFKIKTTNGCKAVSGGVSSDTTFFNNSPLLRSAGFTIPVFCGGPSSNRVVRSFCFPRYCNGLGRPLFDLEEPV